MAVCKEGLEINGVSQTDLDDFCSGFGKNSGHCQRECQETFRKRLPKGRLMSVPQAMEAIRAARLGMSDLDKYFRELQH